MHGHASNAKGKKQSPTYNSWRSMMQRCRNKNHVHYLTYSELGYDPRWAEFSAFLRDMGERPNGTSLDRINNNLGYSKANCRWATAAEQQRNRKSNVLTVKLAESVRQLRSSGYMIKEIATELGLHKSTVTNVLYRGDWL